MPRQTTFPPTPDTLKNRIAYARANQEPLTVFGLDLTKNTELDECQNAWDFFRDVLIPYPFTDAFQKYLQKQNAFALLEKTILIIKNPADCKTLKKELRRIKITINEKFHNTIHANIFESRRKIDELDISDSTLLPQTLNFLKSSPQIKTVLISAEQYFKNPNLNADSNPTDKFYVTGFLTPDELKTIPFVKRIHLSIPFVDRMYDDLDFTHCKINANQIQFALYYPTRANSTKVEVDVHDFINTYNRTFRTNKRSILEILSTKDETEKKIRQTFIEGYCFFTAIEKKIPFCLEEASYFFKKYPESRLLDMIFANDVFNLLQDKASAQQKLSTNTNYNVRRQIIVEAKKNKPLLFNLSHQITSEIFIAEVKKGRRFFRGITVTGDVNLSQLDNKNFSGLDIGNTIFQGKFDASNCILTCTNCQGTVFNGSAIFTSADIRDVNFCDTKFNADFYISDETRVQKIANISGFIFGLDKKNNNTTVNRVVFTLGRNKKEVRFIYNRQSPKLYVAQNESAPHTEIDQTNALLTEFEKQYLHVCKQRAPHYTWFQKFKNLFRDNMIKKLKKIPLSNAEKLHFLFQHVANNPGSRTAFALRETIQEAATDHSIDQPALTRATSFQSISRSHSNASVDTEETLQKNLSAAKKILDIALSTFDNPYLFSNDNNSPSAHEKRKKEQDKIIAAYLLVRTEGDPRVIAHYEHLIKNIIYPNYLNWALSPVSVRNLFAKKFRYNLSEELFMISNMVNNSNHLAVVSERRDEVARSSTFFMRKESAKSREIFDAECLKRWANLPLATINEAGLLDPVTFHMIQKKMSDCIEQGSARLSTERIFYLHELIKQKKYDGAKREAQVIKSVYSSFFSDHNSMQYILINEIFSLATIALKNQIVADSKNLFISPISYSALQLKINESEIHWRNILNPLADIRDILFSDSMIESYNAINIASDGLRNTFALKTISESALTGEQFNYALLLQLTPRENGVSHPTVWVGHDIAKKQLCNALLLVATEEKTRKNVNLSRIDLLMGLYHCIDKLAPISVLLTDKPTPTILNKADVACIYRGVLGTQHAIKLLKNALNELWKYDAIQKAINRFHQGEILSLRDPELSSTRSLIDNSNVNFFKYRHVFNLYAELQSFQRQLNIEIFFSDKDYHGKITQLFDHMIQKIETVRNDIRLKHPDQMGKVFDRIIFNSKTGAGILTEVCIAKMQWEEYCSNLNKNINSSRQTLTV